MAQRQILLHRRHARRRVDPQRERRLARQGPARHAADHHGPFLNQRDRRAVRQRQPGDRIGHRQRIELRPGQGRAIRPVGLRRQRHQRTGARRRRDPPGPGHIRVVADIGHTQRRRRAPRRALVQHRRHRRIRAGRNRRTVVRHRDTNAALRGTGPCLRDDRDRAEIDGLEPTSRRMRHGADQRDRDRNLRRTDALAVQRPDLEEDGVGASDTPDDRRVREANPDDVSTGKAIRFGLQGAEIGGEAHGTERQRTGIEGQDRPPDLIGPGALPPSRQRRFRDRDTRHRRQGAGPDAETPHTSQLALLQRRELQLRRRQQVGQAEEGADVSVGHGEVATGTADIRGLGTRRACAGNDAQAIEHRSQGTGGHLDVADHQGRHIRNAVVDDDRTAVGLLQDDVLTRHLDVVEGGALRQAHHLGGSGIEMGLGRRRRSRQLGDGTRRLLCRSLLRGRRLRQDDPPGLVCVARSGISRCFEIDFETSAAKTFMHDATRSF